MLELYVLLRNSQYLWRDDIGSPSLAKHARERRAAHLAHKGQSDSKGYPSGELHDCTNEDSKRERNLCASFPTDIDARNGEDIDDTSVNPLQNNTAHKKY